jgi:thymidylate synthase
VDIWDEWADEEGELGPVYGYQWRNWCGSHDQIKDLINGIINNPDGRRHIVTAWNPLDVPDMNLPPCHCFFQCYIRGDKLDLKMYQRSADVFLGVPFNIASYALLTNMLAMLTGYMPGRLIVTFGDVHIYMNHTSQVKEQLTRMPSSLPHLKIKRPVHEIDDFKVDDFELLNYYPLPKIEAPVAV